MVDLGTLRWAVEADTQDLDRAQEAMDRTGQSADRTQNSARRLGNETSRTGRTTRRATQDMEQGWNRVSGAARAVRVAVAAIASAAVIRGLNSAIQSAVQLGNTLDKTAQSAGISAERVQELRFAFGQLAEISDQQVDVALQQFNVRLGRAQDGAASMQDQFDALGVSFRQNTGPALEQTLRALAEIPSQSRRAAAAAELFGFRAGPQLAAALSQGAGAVDELAAKLRADGGVISAEAVSRAAEMADMMDRLNRQLTAERTEAVLNNADAIEKLAEAMGRLQRVAIGTVAAVTRFAQFVGEEIAAQIGGVAADDIPRLIGEIQRLEQEIERFEQSTSTRRNRVTLERLRAELAMLQTQLEIAQDLETDAAVERVEQAAEAARKAAEGEPPIEIPTRLQVPDIELLDTDDLRDEAQRFFQMTRTEAENLEAAIARVQRLASAGLFPEGVDEEILRRLQERLDSLADDVETFGDQVVASMADTTGSALEEMFSRGEISASNFMEAVLRDLARVMTQLLIIQPLMEAMFAGPGGGAVGGFLGGIGIPGFASGTRFAPGGAAIVGERGPELVNLPRGSQVTPNSQLGNIGATNVEIIDQRGASSPPVDVQRSRAQGREQIRVLIRGEVDAMFADGSIDKRFRAAGMPVARRGSR